MHNIYYNYIVNKNEENALREMIFARAREREKTISNELQEDIMDLARISFKENNPFSHILKNESNTNINEDNNNNDVAASPVVNNVDNNSEAQEVGFPLNNIHSKIKYRNSTLNEHIVSTTIQNNMLEAREELSRRKSFMGALNFLNSQAAISLIKTRADKFEMIV